MGDASHRHDQIIQPRLDLGGYRGNEMQESRICRGRGVGSSRVSRQVNDRPVLALQADMVGLAFDADTQLIFGQQKGRS